MPIKDEKDYYSIVYSKPNWFIDKLIEQYGKQKTENLLNQKDFNFEHIRANKKLTNLEQIKTKLNEKNIKYKESSIGGLLVGSTNELQKFFNDGLITYQSPSSMLTIKAMKIKPNAKCKILDLCSAPGGKAVYMSEISPKSEIIACDIHKHRIELIEKYAKRMKCDNIKTMLQDGTKFNPNFKNKFDYVLVDAPCSCFGTYQKHPDVFLNKNFEDIIKISKIQKAIIDNATEYLKIGGTLIYSTCTIFKEENQEISKYIMDKNNFKKEKMQISFENDGDLQLLPNNEWDGFYIARFKKYE